MIKFKKPDYIDKEDMVVGKTYRVVIDDCCVRGEFTAVFEGWLGERVDGSKMMFTFLPDDDTLIAEAVFANGVRLDDIGAGWRPVEVDSGDGPE